MVNRPGPGLPSRPCRTAFSTSGWTDSNGTGTGSTSGATRSVTGQPVAEPGLLQHEVPLDGTQLLGQRGELAVPPEGVAGEVRELQQQLPGALRVGADEATRSRSASCRRSAADLRAQRAHLGLHQPGPGRSSSAELQLAGHPPRRPRRWPAPARPMRYGAKTRRVPTTRSSTVNGLTTAGRIRTRGLGQVQPRPTVLPAGRRPLRPARSRAPGAVVAAPSHARTARRRRSAPRAGVPSRSRRWRTARSAGRGQALAQGAGRGSEAVCRVRNVARSASVPRLPGRNSRRTRTAHR